MTSHSDLIESRIAVETLTTKEPVLKEVVYRGGAKTRQN